MPVDRFPSRQMLNADEEILFGEDVGLILAKVITKDPPIDNRATSIALNQPAGGRFTDTAGGAGPHAEILHMTVGFDLDRSDASIPGEQEWMHGVLTDATATTAFAGRIPGVTADNQMTTVGMQYGKAVTAVTEVRADGHLNTSVLAHQMVMLSASQDELHTSHSCGEATTRFGTTLRRARKILSPSEKRDVSAAVMTAERRATHTCDPFIAGSHIRAPTLVSHVVVRAFSFREPTVQLHKFMRIRAKGDDKIVEFSQTVNAATALEVLGEELVRVIPAEELVAIRAAITHVKAFGPLLTKLSGRLCVVGSHPGTRAAFHLD